MKINVLTNVRKRPCWMLMYVDVKAQRDGENKQRHFCEAFKIASLSSQGIRLHVATQSTKTCALIYEPFSLIDLIF
jgi:hypothetical protein